MIPSRPMRLRYYLPTGRRVVIDCSSKTVGQHIMKANQLGVRDFNLLSKGRSYEAPPAVEAPQLPA